MRIYYTILFLAFLILCAQSSKIRRRSSNFSPTGPIRINRKFFKQFDQIDRPWQPDDEQDTAELFPDSIGMSSNLFLSMLIHPIDWFKVHQQLQKFIEEEDDPTLFSDLSLPGYPPIQSIEDLIEFLHSLLRCPSTEHSSYHPPLEMINDHFPMIFILLDRYRRSFLSI